jgi:CRISPR-associated protein Cas2
VRNRYFVTYDIADDRRRAAVYKTLRGYGDHLQYSVFRCDLTERRRIELVAAVHELIDHATDQVLVIDLGPVDGRASICVSSVGRVYTNPERTAVIV